MNLKIFATIHSLMNYTNLIDCCQAHLPVQYALNNELIHQGRTWFILFCVFRVLPKDDVNQVRQNISAYSIVYLLYESSTPEHVQSNKQ